MPLLTLVPILAQFLVSSEARSLEAAKRIFDGKPPNKSLTCHFEVMGPRLGFSLMHWTGFNLAIPAKQFSVEGAQPIIGVAIEVTPKDGTPVYLADRFSFPKPENGQTYPKGAELNYMGGFYIGPGEYRVRTYVFDSKDHECGRDWSFKVGNAPGTPRMEPNQVASVGDERWRGLAKEGEPRRLTVIVEAAPLAPRRNMVRLSSYDRSVLLSSLTTLLDSTKATAATIVAVDPRNRKIIYTSDNFTRRELGRLSRAVADVNLGIVSLETLRGPNETAFMETVLASVQDAGAQSEAVVFLGPVWGWYGKVTPKIRELAQSLPRLHFLGLTRIAGLPDNLVAQTVKSANGSVKTLLSPNDFAKALEKVGPAK